MFSDSDIGRVDKRGMLAAYERWPALAREGFRAKYSAKSRPGRAFILGMGGSASAGDILSGWARWKQGIEMDVLKGGLPPGSMKGAIAIACSVSGNTEETIRMLSSAVEAGAYAVSISGEGAMAETARKLGVPNITVPRALAQRLMLPFLVYSLLRVLDRAFGLGLDADVEESIGALESEWRGVSPSAPEPENDAKKIAAALLTRTPVVYGDKFTRGVAVRFKNVLNENSKRHAHSDAVPEAFHNEIESWEDPSDAFLPIFLRHPGEDPGDKAKIDHMVDILQGAGKGPLQVSGRGSTLLSQLISMTYRLDMASYYLAVALGRDPTPTALLDKLKFSKPI